MLSIIVCSVEPVLLEQLKENIEKTIGVDFELLVYDNRVNKKGLCAVYNLLAAKSKFDVLCFIHEDVIFTTQSWGKVLLQTYFLNDSIGVLGVAGSKYKSAKFSGWFTGQKEFDCANIFHLYTNGNERIYLSPKGQAIEEVVCLDGVFISCRKEIWKKVKFNEDELKGFHLYDLDFTLRSARICSVIVSYEINLIHITQGGDFGDRWIETSMDYHVNHQHELPFTKETNIPNDVELRIAKVSLDVLKTYVISWTNKLKWLKLQKLYNYPNLFYSILKFLFYQPLQLKFIHTLLKSK